MDVYIAYTERKYNAEIENFSSSVPLDTSQVSAANECGIELNTTREVIDSISTQPCIILSIV